MSPQMAKVDAGSSGDQKIPSTTTPISVLFVCLGNICRSPMAHAVFELMTASHPGISKIDSAGTGAYHAGDPPDPRTVDTLRENDIVDFDHDARKVVASDFTDFDYIMAMDEDNLDDLESMRKRLLKKDPGTESRMGRIMLFGDFGGRKGEQVVDPYYGARNGFAVAYEQMVRFTGGFLNEILEAHKTPV